MTITSYLDEPGTVLTALADEDKVLRQQYLSFRMTVTYSVRPVALETVVRKSAVYLELVAMSVCHWEARRELGDAADPATCSRRVRETCGLDVNTVIQEALGEFPVLAQRPVRPMDEPTSEALVRAVRSLIDMCPIREIEVAAAGADLQAWAHRCRLSLDALRAFILRNDEQAKDQIRVVGRAYGLGALTVADAAVLLGLDATDALALLEREGYFRSLDTIQLPEEERDRRLAAIRSDRLSRGGAVAHSRDQVLRDAIASERIEGIDARPWLRREGM